LIEATDRPRNVPTLIRGAVERHPADEALRWKANGGWASWSFAELWQQVRDTSLGLRELGVNEGDRVVILARSRAEWVVADLAVMALGAVCCPLQPSEPPGRLSALVERLAPKALIVENDHLLQRLLRSGGGEPGLPLIGMDPLSQPGSRSLAQLAAAADHSEAARAAWEARLAGIGPEQVATVVQTMGEDGEPRGAVLTHGNVVHAAMASTDAVPVARGDVMLSVLPLSHMFERGSDVLATLATGATVVFADRSVERWVADMAEVGPSVMCVIPFFLQNLERGIRERMAAQPAWARALLRVGIGRGRVRAGVRRALGGRLRFFVSGGAPLPEATARFFASVGVEVLQGYGLTETAPLLTVHRPGAARLGTVGPPVRETEIRLAPGSDEVLARGPQVMSGYLDLPEVNARLVEPDGWFHTGDRGALDPDGHLRITGRLKNLIVLSTGKKVAPAPIERAIEASPLIERAVMLGDGREQVGVLLWAAATAGGEATPGALRHEVERLTGEFATFERPRKVGVVTSALDGAPDDAVERRAWVEAHLQADVAALFS
jgi:long-chain acyl-CoA synthetase